jgi:hypothetical protein
MIRQRRTPRPRAPRMAPTAMKTVPSGALECCMKGAFLVGGTLGAGYVGMAPPLVSVGRPVGPASVSVSPLPEMLTTEECEDVVDEDELEVDEGGGEGEELELVELGGALFFWARTGEATSTTAARVERTLEARMFAEGIRAMQCRRNR